MTIPGMSQYYLMRITEQDLESLNPLPERCNWCGSESSTLKTDVYIWHYELIVVYATNEYKKVIQNTVWCCWWWGGLRTTAFCQARWSIISWCAFPCLWLRCHWFHRILPVTFIEWFTCLTAWSAPMLMNSERKEPVLMQKVFKLASLWLR